MVVKAEKSILFPKYKISLTPYLFFPHILTFLAQEVHLTHALSIEEEIKRLFENNNLITNVLD